MRRYITEKVGLLEVFQTILAVVALSIGYYAFMQDLEWNQTVDVNGVNMCVKINQRIYNKNKTALIRSECDKNPTYRTDPNIVQSPATCEAYLQEFYLTESDTPFEKEGVSIAGFLNTYLKRIQASEVSFVTIIAGIIGLLVLHMIVACCSSSVNMRTKWNAALQGITMFSCGFATMLLAISLNTITNKYKAVIHSYQVPECRILRFCDGVDLSPALAIDRRLEVIIDHILEDYHACQAFTSKTAVCILLMVMIVTSTTMILMAMDLTTKYEEEEQDELARQTQGELDNLIDDQNVNFDTQGEMGDEVLKTDYHHRTGSEAVAEYLQHSKPVT